MNKRLLRTGLLALALTMSFLSVKAEAQALLTATAPMPSAATESDLQKLKEAYNAFMYKVFDVPTDVNDIPADDITTGKPLIYDLAGRRTGRPLRGGIYIVNGMKTVRK